MFDKMYNEMYNVKKNLTINEFWVSRRWGSYKPMIVMKRLCFIFVFPSVYKQFKNFEEYILFFYVSRKDKEIPYEKDGDAIRKILINP